MVSHLGWTTFFLTLSVDDTKLSDIHAIMSRFLPPNVEN